MMNGVAAAAMRNAGMQVDYRVNFGVELPRLQQYAIELSVLHADRLPQLAQSLWKESVRECRMLAILLYPPNDMLPEVADIWVDSLHGVELVQIASLHLWSRMPQASVLSFRWIASENEIRQLAGCYTLIHLLRSTTLSERSEQELMDQLSVLLQSDNPQLRSVAQKLQQIIKPLPDLSQKGGS